MKNVAFVFIILILSSCAELQQIANQIPQTQGISGIDISGGLKEALNNGITKQVSKLTATDVF